MGGTHRIRPAADRDRQPVLDLWIQLIDHHRSFDPAYPPEPRLREIVAREIGRGLVEDACRLLVAEHDSGIDGFLFAEVEAARPGLDAPRSWVHELWVRPERRRIGVASALLHEADGFFREHGVGRVSVRVESANQDGLRFWQHHRFAERARVLERSES